jgi:hypothetical protein
MQRRVACCYVRVGGVQGRAPENVWLGEEPPDAKQHGSDVVRVQCLDDRILKFWPPKEAAKSMGDERVKRYVCQVPDADRNPCFARAGSI